MGPVFFLKGLAKVGFLEGLAKPVALWFPGPWSHGPWSRGLWSPGPLVSRSSGHRNFKAKPGSLQTLSP